MHISIFLSFPKPHITRQAEFIQKVSDFLRDRGFEPRTLGVTDYDMSAPLTAIRRLMLESNGLVTIAFRRTKVSAAVVRQDADLPNQRQANLADVWLTSAWCHIEPSMAYQLGLPILIFREKGVLPEGILEPGVVGYYMPEFDLSQNIDDYLKSMPWKDVLGRWEGFVRAVVETKGKPPALY
jgi:hypothetical protein